MAVSLAARRTLGDIRLAAPLLVGGSKMRRPIAAMVAALLLSLAGCTSLPTPEGYVGPVARIDDSETPRGSTGADFFYLSKIDGRMIDDSLAATGAANYGRGFAMTAMTIGRQVPAQPAHFTIVGQTHYAAPIIALFSSVYKISGDIDFAPLPDHAYIVKGVLGEDYSAVWIEDEATGALAGQKI